MTLATTHETPPAHTAPPVIINPRRAYLELLAVYTVGFAPASVLSIAEFSTSAGLLTPGALAWAHHWLRPCYIWFALAGWYAALVLIHQDLAASTTTQHRTQQRTRWSDALGPKARIAVRAAMALSVPAGGWAAYNAQALMNGDLLWRWVLAAPTATLVLLILNRHGVTPAQIGLRRRRGATDGAVARRVFTRSTIGILVSVHAGYWLIYLVLSFAPTARIARGEPVSMPPLTAIGTLKLVLMDLANAINEEMTLSALLVALMLGARQPRWRWMALAGVLRLGFHLYAGVWGFAQCIFAINNAVLFARTRRILALITAHFVWDLFVTLLPDTRLVVFNVDVLLAVATLLVIALAVGADRAISALRGAGPDPGAHGERADEPQREMAARIQGLSLFTGTTPYTAATAASTSLQHQPPTGPVDVAAALPRQRPNPDDSADTDR